MKGMEVASPRSPGFFFWGFFSCDEGKGGGVFIWRGRGPPS